MTIQFQFFLGTENPSKITIVCITAVRRADEGKRTLLVSTGLGSALTDIFEQPIAADIVPISNIPNLWATNIDLHRVNNEHEGWLSHPIVEPVQDQMSSMDCFTNILDSTDLDGFPYDLVIFDIARNSHILGLLKSPFKWIPSTESVSGDGDEVHVRTAAVRRNMKLKLERIGAAMRNSDLSTFIYILQPEAKAIKETKRALADLEKLNIQIQQLIVNEIIPIDEKLTAFPATRAGMQLQHLEQIQEELPLPRHQVPMFNDEISGLKGLREAGELIFDGRQKRE